jgi:hypothetical protein
VKIRRKEVLPPLTFRQIKPGDLFQYPHDTTVWMKIQCGGPLNCVTIGDGAAATSNLDVRVLLVHGLFVEGAE